MSPGRGLTRDGWKTTYRYPAHVKPDMGSEGRQVYGTPDPEIETGQDPPEYGTAS